MKSVKYTVSYTEKAGRLELFVRWIWMIPSVIVMMVLAIIGSIALCLQWLHILFLAKRNKELNKWIFKYYSYYVKLESYMLMLTDERNPIMPED